MSDLSKLKKFLNADYRASYLDSHVKGSIAYQIQAIREKLGLTQTQFGDLVGMPQAVISRLESAEGGGLNVNTLLRIANGLKIGLGIQFCNFDSVLASDVSPAGLTVENIDETISRLQAAQQTDTSATDIVLVAGEPSTLEGTHTWWMKTYPNQKSIQIFKGSATPSSEMYTLTQASPV